MKRIKTRKLRRKNNKVFKYLIGLMMGVLVFFCIRHVEAGNYDSLLEKNRLDGVYAVATIEGRSRIFYLNMYELNNKVSYCIDLGVDITTEMYNSTTDFNVSNLTDEQIDYIRAVSYFGYGYLNHDDYRYYMAAQELIWEYLGDVDVVWTNELRVDGERINIDSYKDDILDLHDFYNRELTLEINSEQVYRVGEEIILEDSSNILSDYEVVSSKYSDVFIEGNKLIIKVGNAIGEEKIELRRKGYYDYNSLFYYYETSQRLISSGNYKEVDEVLTFDIEGATLEMQLVDDTSGYKEPNGEASFKGAIFEIYDINNKLVGTYTTDEKGYFKADGLLLGRYYYKQVASSEGYLMNGDVSYFVISKEKSNFLIRQKVITNTIEIRKVYGSNGNYKPENGILFILYNYLGRDQALMRTNDVGNVRIRLQYGSYRVKQMNTTEGYSKVDDFIIDVREQVDGVVYYNLVDELILARVRVNTLDMITEERFGLEGFSYRILRGSDNTYVEFDGVDIFTTDEYGNLLLPIGLEYGEYVLEQVSVPKGVILNNDSQEFSINKNSNLNLVDGDLVFDVNYYNKMVMGQVEVLALEEKFYKNINDYGYENMVRIGSEFILLANEDIVRNGKVIYKNGDEIYREKTDLNGKLVFNDLELGNYCLWDKDSDEKKCFMIESINNNDEVVKVNMEFLKTLNKKNIIIKNISNRGDAIQKSVFELVSDDDIVIYTGITNEEGIIKIDNLLVGNYCIRQKNVADKYSINDELVCFKVEQDKEIEFINEVVEFKLVNVPDTLSMKLGIRELLLIILVIGTGYFVYKKIFASRLYR